MAFGAKIQLTVDKSHKSQFRSQIQQMVNDAVKANPVKIKAAQFDLSSKAAKDLAKQLNTALKDHPVKITISRIDAGPAVENLRRQLTTMLSGLKITGVKEFVGDASVDSFEKRVASISAMKKEIASIQSVLNSANRQMLNYGGSGDIERAKADYREILQLLEQAQSQEGALQEQTVASASAKTNALMRYINELKSKGVEEDKQAAKEDANRQRELENLRKVQQALLKIERLKANNPKMLRGFGEDIEGLQGQLRGMLDSGVFDPKTYAEVNNALVGIELRAKELGATGKTFANVFAEGWSKFGGWTIITRSLSAVIRVFKDMVKAVKEVDIAMTELRKVTDLTADAYSRFFDRATQMAYAVGASVADTVNAVADFARLGFTLGEAEELANAALVYKNVGDGIDNISQATESLISTIKAFGGEANNAMSIVDKFNEVGRMIAQWCSNASLVDDYIG